jgi:uncharacterized protein (TIGR02145 family)
MKVIVFFIFLLLLTEDSFAQQGNHFTKFGTVTIGSQVWMKHNLDVDHYRNGDPIPEVKDPDEWANLKTGAWCYYENDPANGKTYGKLYNWYAVNDPRGLAPEGWHVSSDEEWKEMEKFLGGSDIAGSKLKATGTLDGGDGLWRSPTDANVKKFFKDMPSLYESARKSLYLIKTNNSSGFTALPGGVRVFLGNFIYLNYFGSWWTSTSTVDEDFGLKVNWYRELGFHFNSVTRDAIFKKEVGSSVRCVRD